jgi:hypothetical protein
MICGCHSCNPLLTAVLPANTTLSVNTCLFKESDSISNVRQAAAFRASA